MHAHIPRSSLDEGDLIHPVCNRRAVRGHGQDCALPVAGARPGQAEAEAIAFAARFEAAGAGRDGPVTSHSSGYAKSFLSRSGSRGRFYLVLGETYLGILHTLARASSLLHRLRAKGTLAYLIRLGWV